MYYFDCFSQEGLNMYENTCFISVLSSPTQMLQLKIGDADSIWEQLGKWEIACMRDDNLCNKIAWIADNATFHVFLSKVVTLMKN